MFNVSAVLEQQGENQCSRPPQPANQRRRQPAAPPRPRHGQSLQAQLPGHRHPPLPAAAIKLTWVHGKRVANINACIGDTITFAWARGAQHDLLETKVRGVPRRCSSGGTGGRLQ